VTKKVVGVFGRFRAVSPDVVFTSRTGVEAFISGIMRRFRGQYTRTDAAGLNSMFFARTMRNDLIQANTWFRDDYANDNREPTYTSSFHGTIAFI
jgi:hypothetical protein